MTFLAYETSADSSSPVELYKFVNGSSKYYHTSADEEYLFGIDTYIPTTIKRGKITQANEGVRNDLKLEVTIEHPIVQLFRGSIPERSIPLTIYRTHLQDPDQEVNLFWSGVILNVSEKQFNATIVCRPTIGFLKNPLLRPTFQRKCNHTIYDDYCTLNRTSNEIQENIIAGSGLNLTISGIDAAFADGDLIGGTIQNTDGQFAMITDNVASDVVLFTGLSGTDIGDVVRIAPGCQQSDVRCKALGNYDNYLGFKDVPNHDLHTANGVKGNV